MARHSRQPITQQADARRQSPNAAPHLPAKQPTLLAASIILFALWFVFLFVTALFG
jgi:hypothetical protein